MKRFLYKEGGDQDATLPFVLRSYFSLAGNVIFNSLFHANRKLMKLNRGKGVHEKGGASVLAGFLDGDLLALANVGVCSAWLLREGRAVELVMPRGYGRLADPFDVFLEDAPIPLAALGISDDIEPEVFEYRVRPGDWLLMQSPGAGRAVRDRFLEMQQNWLQGSPSEGELQNALNEIRFQCNASILLAVFKSSIT